MTDWILKYFKTIKFNSVKPLPVFQLHADSDHPAHGQSIIQAFFCSPLMHPIVFNDSISGQWRPWSDCANAQADLAPLWHMPEDTFLHDAAHVMHNVEKGPLCNMRTAKVRMSVCIRAVWSGHSLFVDIYYSIRWFCKRTAKDLIICAGWSGSAFSANCKRAFFVRCASYDLAENTGRLDEINVRAIPSEKKVLYIN